MRPALQAGAAILFFLTLTGCSCPPAAVVFRDRYIYSELPALPPQTPYFTPEWSMAGTGGQYCLDGPNAAKLRQNVRSLMDDNAWLRGMITDLQKQRDELARQEAKQEHSSK